MTAKRKKKSADCRRCTRLWKQALRLKIRLALAYTALKIIGDDDTLECRCGHDPYTDGELCPRCYAWEMADMLAADLPKKLTGKR